MKHICTQCHEKMDWNEELYKSDTVCASCKGIVSGRVVKKISGKPFKSGKKTAIVSGVVQRETPSAPQTGSTPHNPIRKMVIRDFYTFSTEEEGYVCAVNQCEKVS